MNKRKRVKHHLARSLEVGDTIQLTLTVRGRVKSKATTPNELCVITVTEASFQVPSFEVTGNGAERTVAKRSRSASWSVQGDRLELACELASTQRVEYIGLPKSFRDSLSTLSVAELRELITEVEASQKALPPPPPASQEPQS